MIRKPEILIIFCFKYNNQNLKFNYSVKKEWGVIREKCVFKIITKHPFN
jgi:hypothetical protein